MNRCWMLRVEVAIPEDMKVVLPACSKDWKLMADNLQWQAELDGVKPFGAVLSLDGGLHPDQMEELETLARATYRDVERYIYPTAPQPIWPNGPNWAFQHTARHLAQGTAPWFWMEPDCVPLRHGWLDIWNREYQRCGQPLMGILVPGMGHCNGTAVYPSFFPHLSLAAMTCTDIAWDGLMKEETVRYTHNAPHLLCHVWGVNKGVALPHGGVAPTFQSWWDVERWVDLRAVLFHRAKDNSLIRQLRAHESQHFHPRVVSGRPLAPLLSGVHP